MFARFPMFRVKTSFKIITTFIINTLFRIKRNFYN